MSIPLSYQNSNEINLAAKVSCTEAEGPGKRYALWMQGCPFRCLGCCNPHMLAFDDAKWCKVEDLVREICDTPNIEGITLLGGEPFAQANALSKLCQKVRKEGLSVMVFTGFTLEQIQSKNNTQYQTFLEQVDLLVDGSYIQKQHTQKRRWIGSENQVVHFLTKRYSHLKKEPTSWDSQSNTIELRISGDSLLINGFPHPNITEILEQLTKTTESKRKEREPT